MQTRTFLFVLSSALIAVPAWSAPNDRSDHDKFKDQTNLNAPYMLLTPDVSNLPATGAGPGTTSPSTLPTPDTSTSPQPTITDEPAPMEPAPLPQ